MAAKMFDNRNTGWQTFSMVVTASGVNPTRGTVVYEKAVWRRVGDSIEIRWDYRQTTAGVTGTGDYQFALPNSLQIDYNKIAQPVNTSFGQGQEALVGHCVQMTNGGVGNQLSPMAFDATTFKVSQWASANLFVGSGHLSRFGQNNVQVSLFAKFPVVGWS